MGNQTSRESKAARRGERLSICPACLIQNQTALSIVQSSFRDVVPSQTAISERVLPERQAQGDFGSHGPINSGEASRTLPFDVPQPDSEEKHALMEDLRCSNEKRTQKITSVLYKLDERLTNIQNMASRVTSGEACIVDGSSAKLLAELRSLEVKTRSLDAKLTAADRKQEEMQSKIMGATENLRNFLDQLVVLENRNKLLDDNVHSIVRRLGGYEESSRALGERVNSVRRDMEYLQESTKKSDDKIDSLSTAVQFQLKKMKDMEGNFMDMDERLDKVSEQVGTVEGKLNSRAIKVADVTAKLIEFDNKFRTTDQAIRKIEGIQESLKDLPDVQVKLRQLSDKVEYETSGLPSAESLMREVDRIVEPLKRKLESVDQKLAEVQREQVEVAKPKRVSDLPSALKSPQSKKVTFVEPAPMDRPNITPSTSLEHGKDEKDLNKFEESDSSGASEEFESRQTPAVNQAKLPTRPRSAPAGRPVPLLATKAFSLRAAGKSDFMGGSDDALSSRNPLKSSLKTSMDSLVSLAGVCNCAIDSGVAVDARKN
ncbi:hypothetical protein RvY_13733 [Ramazzottius varieornatus]|uniref:Uncharacterized protein n=1 Tax=Ramazzottius varieornatus TaxID=947166 RepID=A0A1D1VNY3_RAMVA|nr:hypothetical protein RvY_13733 [Ramazzottius varieornatus]